MRVRTLEELLFPEGLTPDKWIPSDPYPALNFRKIDVASKEDAESALQFPIAA